METIIEIISRETDLIIGGLIIYVLMIPIFNFFKRILVERWHDIAGFITAIILGIIYGFLRNSAFAALEAIAGSQLIFILVKKGILSVFLSKK